MKEFIELLLKASDAMNRMSECWVNLSNEDQDTLNSFKEWNEGFNCPLDEVPLILWAIVDKLEELGGK
jgi:hypothetical protein